MSLDIHVAPAGAGQQHVALHGRLDTHSFARLDEALAPILAAPVPPHALVLDLGGLEYISSAGIRSCTSACLALAPVVMTVKVRSHAPSGCCQPSHSPAAAIGAPSAIATA